VELPVWNLAATPGAASATLTVTSADGYSHEIELTRETFDCSEGTLYFSGPEAEGLVAAKLGPSPGSMSSQSSAFQS
jgi:hypothetical protein